MKLLRDLCGSDFDQVREEFLYCLARVDPWSDAKVYSYLAIKQLRLWHCHEMFEGENIIFPFLIRGVVIPCSRHRLSPEHG